MGQSCLHRFKMLSFYMIMLVCLSFSVEAEQQTCQQGDNSICGLPDFEESDFNPCCEGFKCYEWEDEMGYSFCMDKDAKRIPLNGTCAGFRANCEEGLKCNMKGTKTCVVPAQLGEDCEESPCAKGLRCGRKEKKCVTPAQLGEDCGETPCAKGLRCKKGTKKCVAPAKLGEDCSRESPCAKRLRCKKKNKEVRQEDKKKLKMES